MSDASVPDDAREDSLANVPPRPVEQDERRLGFGGVCAIFAATTGIVWFVGVHATSSLGATRSSKLIWQQQQAEMRAAECATQSNNETEHE